MWFDFKRTCLSIVIILTLNHTVNASKLIVKNQSDFDRLAVAIKELLNSGSNVDVFIRKGVYYFSDEQLLLKDIHKPGLSVKISGKSAVLVSMPVEYRRITPYNATINGHQDVNIWSDIYNSPEKVSIVDINKKLCRLKRNDNLEVKEGGYLLLTKWYTSGLYMIEKIENDYIYFSAPNTRYREKYGEYDVNFDYVYNKTYPRYKLLITNTFSDEYNVCSSSSFFVTQNCQFSKVEISGLTFIGGSGEGAVVKFKELKAYVVKMTNCIFSALRNKAVAAEATNNVTIDRCIFTDCYSTVVTTDEDCSNLTVKNNVWVKCGQLLDNPSCVVVSGMNYLIKDNTFEDFYGRALTLGVYFSKGNSVKSSGMVENNEFYFTPSFLESAPYNLLMDNGAIYVNTLNDNLEIRNNYIHDFAGAGDNRGIFLDDGAINVKITGNVIANIAHGFAISARRVKSVESTVGLSNVGNSIQGNIIEGRIRFEGNELSNNGCEYGENYLLVKSNSEVLKNTLKNVNLVGEDIFVTYTGYEKGKICIENNSYMQMRKSPVWKNLKNRIVLSRNQKVQ